MSRIQSQQTAQIEVEGTGEVIDVTCSDLTWDVMQDGEERGMGPELLHLAEFEFDGGTVTWKVWEYPPGTLGHVGDPIVDGGTLIRDFEISLVP
jgi:hypothetical protein